MPCSAAAASSGDVLRQRQEGSLGGAGEGRGGGGARGQRLAIEARRRMRTPAAPRAPGRRRADPQAPRLRVARASPISPGKPQRMHAAVAAPAHAPAHAGACGRRGAHHPFLVVGAAAVAASASGAMVV
jgi:hypothetical protein